LLVTGANLFPVQSYVYAAADNDSGDYKTTEDYKDSIHEDINAKSDRTNQHLGQDNLCHKDDDCEQADEGQQLQGKDNEVNGFNDQSKNIQQQQPIAPTPKPTPTTGTLTVAKHVVCNFDYTNADCPTADIFNITATTINGSSISFSGTESGTSLRINPPFPLTYQVTETGVPLGFVVDTIPVGILPEGVAFNPNNSDLYVTNLGDNSVSVIDTTTNTVVGPPIPVRQPVGIAFNPINGDMYVTNGGNTVSVIDSATNTVTDTIPVELFPRGIAFNPDNGNMYVTNSGSSSVSVIDTTTNTVVAPPVGGPPLLVGIQPVGIAFNPINGDMYVTNRNSNTVSVIDSATNTVTGTIDVGAFPFGIAFNPNNGDMYVTNQFSNTVSVIDSATNTVIDTIILSVGSSPFGIAFNPDNGFLYVTNEFSNSVSVIDSATNTVVGPPIPLGLFPRGIAFNPDNGFLYVTNNGNETVSVVAPLTTTYSSGCNGSIDSAGQAATCDITNTYGRPV